ncbi:unnamed protein product [Bathycoccus prasinos]
MDENFRGNVSFPVKLSNLGIVIAWSGGRDLLPLQSRLRNSTISAVDWIIIATPATTHFSVALEALEAGKNVFIEKPATISLADTERLFSKAKQKDLKVRNLSVKFCNHWWSPVSTDETGVMSRDGLRCFLDAYKVALLDHPTAHYYAIAKEGSLMSREEMISFCERLNLSFKEVANPLIYDEMVSLVIEVEEELWDHDKLRAECWRLLNLHAFFL